MTTSWRFRVIPVCVAILTAGSAAAQTAFTGSWSGSVAITQSTVCDSNPAFNCTGSAPWNGSVDSQGLFSFTYGNGTLSCGGISEPLNLAGITDATPVPLSSNGALSYPAISNTVTDSGATSTVNCPAWSLAFSTSPSRVTGTESCTIVGTSSGSQCNITEQFAFSGSGSGSAAPQIFPITVSSNITATTANATATVQPPSQLLGQVASVFVFAHARQSLLAGSKRVATPIRRTDGTAPDPCVLAQLNPNGQLVAANTSSLSAYATGVQAAANQSVTILNNVATPNVAGATFFVGYGANSSSMIAGGTYEGAVSVNGSSSCSGALLAAAAPKSPSALSGLWWNASESGWGVSFTQRRNILFAAVYTYDGSGNPKWYVASDCEMPSGVTGTSGTCNGSLFEVSGPTFFGTTFNPGLVHASSAGTLSVAFQDANTASMTYSAAGQTRTVPLTRQPIASGTAPPAIDYTDLWYSASESGWGMSITQQFGMMFLAWYVYDGNGKPVWYVAPECVVVGSGCSGALYRTTGPAFGPTFNPTAVQAFPAGTVSLTFSDANNGSVSYTVDGASGTKAITRQVF